MAYIEIKEEGKPGSAPATRRAVVIEHYNDDPQPGSAADHEPGAGCKLPPWDEVGSPE